MASKSCIIITKYFLFVFNLFFFFLGGVMLGFGLWILFDKTSFIAVLDSASVPLQLWSYLLSGLGIFTMMMGFLGCIGALKEVKCMLGIYFTFLVFLMASQIIIGVLVFTQRKMIEKKVSVAVEDLIKNYNRDDDKSENLEESWDFIQLKFSCCGWNRFDEWLNNPIISKNISKESLLNFDTYFNFSCSCHNSFSKNLTHNVTKETGFCLTHGILQQENSQGCKRNVFQWMQQNIISIMIICVGITVVEFLQFLCISLNRRRTEHTAREDHPVLPTRASYLEYWQGSVNAIVLLCGSCLQSLLRLLLLVISVILLLDPFQFGIATRILGISARSPRSLSGDVGRQTEPSAQPSVTTVPTVEKRGQAEPSDKPSVTTV